MPLVTAGGPEPRSEPPPDPARITRRIFAVGGGRAGVGKATVATSLAVYLAQVGRRVLLIDADATGANLHLALGVPRPLGGHRPKPEEEPQSAEEELVITSVAGLRLWCAPEESGEGGGLKGSRKVRILELLRRVADYDIVVDVGPGVSHAACDLFLAADVGVLVTVPEPAAVESTYRFVRAMFLRELRRSFLRDRTRTRALDRVLTEFPPLPAPIELTRHLLRVEPVLGESALQTLERLRPRLLVNQTRIKSDLELPSAMALVGQRRLGITMDPLGYVEHDDAVWLAQRHRRPLLVDNPSSKAGRCLERASRRILAIPPRSTKPVEVRGLPPPMNHYDLLQVQRGASDEEVRRAYKRQRETYAVDGLPVVSIFSEQELQRQHALFDEALEVLLDPVRRRAYDVSTFPDHERSAVPSPAQRLANEAAHAEQLQLAALVALEVGPDTEFTGALLRRVRESQGVELREIAQHTKVAVAHLEAIEEEAFGKLPPLVYVRGFLLEIAKFLKLDAVQVARTYLRRAKELIELRG